MSEFSMENIGRPELPKKSTILTVTLELTDPSDAIGTLSDIEGVVSGEKASVVGFNLFDSYRGLY